MKKFKKLSVWQNEINIVMKIYAITILFPQEEKFGLTSQMNRASVCIPSNVSGGSNRDSVKEHKYYLQIVLGSCLELETQLLIAEQLKFVQENGVDKLEALIDQEQKMLMSFINKL